MLLVVRVKETSQGFGDFLKVSPACDICLILIGVRQWRECAVVELEVEIALECGDLGRVQVEGVEFLVYEGVGLHGVVGIRSGAVTALA
jgi:hypothetical protein